MTNLIFKPASEITTSDKIYAADGYEYTVTKVEKIGRSVFISYDAPFSPFRGINTIKVSPRKMLCTGVKPSLRGVTQDGVQIWA